MADSRFDRIAKRYLAHTGRQSTTIQHEIKVNLDTDLKVRIHLKKKLQITRAEEEAEILISNLTEVVHSIMKEFDECPTGKCEDMDVIRCRCVNPPPT